MLRTDVDSDGTPGAGLKEGRDAARRLVRELVCSGLPHFNEPAQGPLRLFTLARIRPDRRAEGGEAEAAALCAVPTGWMPKPGFGDGACGAGGGMKLRRCSPVIVTMGGEAFAAAAAGGGGSGAMWVQHTAAIKGLPHPSEEAGQ